MIISLSLVCFPNADAFFLFVSDVQYLPIKFAEQPFCVLLLNLVIPETVVKVILRTKTYNSAVVI